MSFTDPTEGVFEVDFSGVEDRKPVAEGAHVAEVVGIEQKPVPWDQSPGLEISFGIQGGEFAGRVLKQVYPVTGADGWRLRNLLGIVTDRAIPKDRLSFREGEVVGKVVEVSVAHKKVDDGSGEPMVFERVKGVRKVSVEAQAEAAVANLI